MKYAQGMIIGRKFSDVDSKGRTVIASTFRHQLEGAEILFMVKKRAEGYPVLELRPDIKIDFEKMTEEDRLRLGCAIPLALDNQGRVRFIEGTLEYLAKNEEIPKRILQTGGGDRIYIWHPADFADWENKHL